jgi:multidrug efflux pump subunit AcrA (membrane-fusion protein)
VYVRLPAAAAIGTGEPLSGELIIPGRGSAPSIPYGALLDDAGQPYVYVVIAGHAHRRDVMPGPVMGARVAILRGLKPGEMVVVQGGTALEDGMQVRTK